MSIWIRYWNSSPILSNDGSTCQINYESLLSTSLTRSLPMSTHWSTLRLSPSPSSLLFIFLLIPFPSHPHAAVTPSNRHIVHSSWEWVIPYHLDDLPYFSLPTVLLTDPIDLGTLFSAGVSPCISPCLSDLIHATRELLYFKDTVAHFHSLCRYNSHL